MNAHVRDESPGMEPAPVLTTHKPGHASSGPVVAGNRVGAYRKEVAADWLFAGVIVVTAWWYLRVSRGQSFIFDDWRVATRSLSFGDLFEPHNGHLSIVPLAIYRALLGEFGLETYTPYRLLGIGSLLCLGIALFLLARSRIGAPLALVIVVSVLWLPTTNLTPFLANFHFALVCGVACAAVIPSPDRRSDLVVGLALVVALSTSSVGVPVAAACGVHALMVRRLPSRLIAVAAPSLLWLVWWRTLGNQPRPLGRPSVLSALGDTLDGVFGSFGALTGGWWVGGTVLLAGWAVLLMHRVRTDPASALTQVAWTAGLVIWWVGLVWSRPGAADSTNTGRYEYVGAVLILLSALPAFPVEWLRTSTARWRMAAPALLVVGAIVVVNHDELRQSGRNRALNATRAEMVLYELEQTVQPVEPTRRLTPVLARISAHDYRQKILPRHGSSIDLHEAPDEALIARNAVRVPIAGPAAGQDQACVAGPVTLQLGHPVPLQTGDEPVTVGARRFGRAMVDVKRVPAHRSAVVRVAGPTVVEGVPWVIQAPGACIREG